MPDLNPSQQQFITKATGVVEDHIENEQFGVSELADQLGMSRSNLLRKIKKLTNLSVSQFIREVRLRAGMEFLKENSYTVSEVAFKVGFSSTSYFIKCFGDYYGYPPGTAAKEAENSHTHQLVAIMFTDIEGYTALMQEDEQKAVAFRARHREVFKTTTIKYRGKILQYYGDGTLSTFNSAIDAVRCAIELQLAFSEEPRLPVRIGIHSGDIIFTEDDIIGDGVNVASRIESLAQARSVLISEKVYDEIKNQKGIHAKSLGSFELKNVNKPLEVYAITNPGLVVTERETISGKLNLQLDDKSNQANKSRFMAGILWVLIPLAVMLIGYLTYTSGLFDSERKAGLADEMLIGKKSVAVLPFINDSDDSSNVYIVNGLMESILNNLQKIEDLRVISRTSVEKYRNNPMIISDIASELKVNYIIEGSGQKIGDKILLSIQLIDASRDQHLWSDQYDREVKDIFILQQEVARSIAEKIEVFITPEEEFQIEKIPTKNLVAYDYFLQGQDLFYQGNREYLEQSIPYFLKAIEEDENFARAHAVVAIAYYFMDIYQQEKLHTEKINEYADQALLLDPTLAQSLIAKALYYMQVKDYEQVPPYLEKALKYNPNSALVIQTLADFYANYYPDTEKYLEYALKGIRLDPAAQDSATSSYIYLHIGNALIQSGFTEEAERYINKSLAYNPNNLYSLYVKAYILYVEERDPMILKERLINALRRDTTRLDILQEVGKVCYFMQDYEQSYFYYKKFADARKNYHLEIFPYENAKIGFVYNKMGLLQEADSLFQLYKEQADLDNSLYKHLSLTAYYAYIDETEKAIAEMKLFIDEERYYFWNVIFLRDDPIIEKISHHPEFEECMQVIEKKFWENHARIRKNLEEQELLGLN